MKSKRKVLYKKDSGTGGGRRWPIPPKWNDLRRGKTSDGTSDGASDSPLGPTLSPTTTAATAPAVSPVSERGSPPPVPLRPAPPVVALAPEAPPDTEPSSPAGVEGDVLLNIFDKGIPLPELKKRIQNEAIARALRITQGNITRAAEILGMRRPRLSQIINADDGLKALCQGSNR